MKVRPLTGARIEERTSSAASPPTASRSTSGGAVGIRLEPAAAIVRAIRRADPPGAGARADVAVALGALAERAYDVRQLWRP